MTPLDQLAARVEAATGADRELDGWIWWATLTADQIEHYDQTGFVRRCIKADGSAGIALQQFLDSRNPACLARVAFANAYTASLDAAMTLVPGGAFTIGLLDAANPEGLWRAVAGDTRVNAARGAYAATPALALTAACLRALDAGGGGE